MGDRSGQECCKGRPRSDESRCAILAATLKLLEDKPLREISVEAIAREAGVGKATIYKWWPGKAFVALDAFLERTKRHVVVPDTGSAREDFRTQLRSLIRYYKSKTGRLFVQFVAEGQNDPDFAASFREVFLRTRRDEARIILQRGRDRGELHDNLDEDIVLDLMYSPVVYRLLTGHAPVRDETVDRIIASVFDGVANR